jgi:hypothetical protein
MSRSLGTLTLDLVAKVGGFVEGLSKAERESKKRSSAIQKNIRQIRSGLDSAAKASAGFAAAYVASVVLTVNKGREAADQQAKLAQRFNTTSEAIGTLTRAGQLTGTTLEQIGTAGRQLDVNLGKAAQGVGAQADAIEKLGLSAQKLQSMSLEDRIAAINEALRTNVSASERAAVAADLFGSRSAQAISLIDTSVIETARKESELFGHALSAVDLAQIEIGNDAFGRISSAVEGFSKQLALQFAPVLQAIGDLFLDVAEDAGGMGNIAGRSFDSIVKGVAFAANAADGLKRTFSLAADTIIMVTSKAAQYLATVYATILEQISKLPGVDFSDTAASLREFSKTSQGIVSEAMTNMSETIAAPFAGDMLKEKIAEYQDITAAAAAMEIERRGAFQAQITEIDAKAAGKRLSTAITEQHRLGEQFVNQQIMLDEAFENRLLSEEAYHDMSTANKQAFEDGITAIENQAAADRMGAAKNILGQLSTLMNGHSRKLFEVGKVAAIAGAIVSGIEATQDAFKWGMKIGGPPLAGAFAGAAALATGARIQQIARTKFGGGSSGVSNTQSVSAGAAPAMTTQDQMPTRNVYFSGISPDEFYRGDMIIEAIDTELRNGGRFAGIIG